VRNRLGAAAVVGVLAAAVLLFILLRGDSDSACGPGECSAPPVSMTCPQIGHRDLNPSDRPVAPSRSRPLIPRRPDGRIPLGFNDSAYQAGQIGPAEDAALQRAAGSTLWRTPVNWGSTEPQPGHYEFGVTDTVYCAAVAAGLRPVLDISGSPPWASAAGCTGPCPVPPSPQHDRALERFAEKIAIRYPESAAIEAWNEPNLHQYWRDPDPARYTQVLRAVYVGVKDGDPRTPVLGGAISNRQADDVATGDISLGSFLRGMAAAGAGRYLDGLSVHPYPVYPLNDPRELFLPSMHTVRALAPRFGGSQGPRVWITEVGAPTAPATGPPFSPDAQARTLLGIYRWANAAPDVDGVIVHTLITPNRSIPGSPGYGWLIPQHERGRFLPKPVYCAFARLLATPIDCAMAVPQ
jgi:hypothetical protein